MNRRKNCGGFTLIELVCVIAILGILIAVAVPSYQSIQDQSARQVALSNARTNYSMGKAQQEMVDAGVMDEDETEDYGYDPDTDSADWTLPLIPISEPTRRYAISYSVFCLIKKITF